MTEIRFYHGSELLMSVESNIDLDGFDTRSAAIIASDYMRKKLGYSGLAETKISVVKTWEGRYFVKACLQNKDMIRDINLANLLK